MTTVQMTTRYKVKRVIKYLLVLLVFMIVTKSIDRIILMYVTDPFITFGNDWMMVYGAMWYRLISTWGYR